MKSVLTIIVAMFVVVGFGAMPGIAGDTCTFDPEGTTGVWALASNWDDCSFDYPKAGDTAVIPNGKTCQAVNTPPDALSLDINAGGRLEVTGVVLALYGSSSTVDGTLFMEPVGQSGGGVLIEYNHTFGGTGTITSDDNALLWGGLSAPFPDLTIGSDLTVDGDVSIQFLDLINNGTIRVADAGANPPYGTLTIAGTGEFQISAGRLELDGVTFSGTGLEWKVSGGTLEIDNACTGCTGFAGKILLSGGTLEVNENLCVAEGIDFSGGEIDVASGESAEFGGACP